VSDQLLAVVIPSVVGSVTTIILAVIAFTGRGRDQVANNATAVTEREIGRLQAEVEYLRREATEADEESRQ
jgi:hypothetical protein